MDKVFDSFFRADTARDRSGTGLGLAIAKSILDQHGERIVAHSDENGTEFAFWLEAVKNRA